MSSRFEPIVERLRHAVLESDGTLDRTVRRAAAGLGDAKLPAALVSLVDTIRRHAYRVSDADIVALQDAGYSDDQLYELVTATALGEGLRRIRLVETLLATRD